MQEITYVFIDGGYLKITDQETFRKLFGDHFENELTPFSPRLIQEC